MPGMPLEDPLGCHLTPSPVPRFLDLQHQGWVPHGLGLLSGTRAGVLVAHGRMTGGTPPGGQLLRPTPPLKSTGFEKYGLVLGKIALQIFRLGTGHHRRVSINCVVKYPARLRLKGTGSHPLNPLPGNPIEPVPFRRRVGALITM